MCNEIYFIGMWRIFLTLWCMANGIHVCNCIVHPRVFISPIFLNGTTNLLCKVYAILSALHDNCAALYVKKLKKILNPWKWSLLQDSCMVAGHAVSAAFICLGVVLQVIVICCTYETIFDGKTTTLLRCCIDAIANRCCPKVSAMWHYVCFCKTGTCVYMLHLIWFNFSGGLSRSHTIHGNPPWLDRWIFLDSSTVHQSWSSCLIFCISILDWCGT